MNLTWGAIARLHQRAAEMLIWLARKHAAADGFCQQRQAGLTARWTWCEAGTAAWVPVAVGVAVWAGWRALWCGG